jgi:hypothetical protein
MKMLESIQNNFYTAIFQGHTSEQDFIASSHPIERLAIYRQTIIDNLCNALALTFPGVWKLLGEQCANNLAHAFCRDKHNLPSSGGLDDWGAHFPDFLSHQQQLLGLPYIKDYATYEWLKHQAYCSPSSHVISGGDLQAVPEDLIESIKLKFLPSFFMISSIFPLNEIQDIVENPQAEAINTNKNRVYALIARSENTVEVFWVGAEFWLFIDFLVHGLSLGKALQNMQEKNLDFNLAQSLHFILQKKFVAQIIMPC